MSFIYTYFGTKIAAIGKLLKLTKDAWNNRIWLGVVLLILWTLFCTIGGILLLPIDIIWCAIMWYKNPFAREVMEETMDELVFD